MTKLKSLFQKAWTAVVNPGQDERVDQLVKAIGRELQAKRGAFELAPVIQRTDCSPKELEIATRQYYSNLLQRYWSDGMPSENQKKILAILGKKLQIPQEHISGMNIEVTVVYFGAKLGSVLEDGVVTDDELAELSQIASFAQLTVPELVREHISTQGIGILRALFAEAASTGILEQTTWRNLLASAQRIGLTADELKAAVMPLARSFAEHVLADVKSDGMLSDEESAYMDWLMRSFDFDPAFLGYVQSELRLLRERTRILNGQLPTVPIPFGTNLNPGELLYLCQPSIVRITKVLKSGARHEDHRGRLLLTDNRLLFESPTKAIRIAYRSIITWNAVAEHIRVSVANKPEVQIFLPPAAEPLLAEKFGAIIQLHSQIIRKKVEGTIDRHIPREVRQRVWQRYGGKCADCGAMDYLEFDHIVPVAKGGSNSEQNVQLLCRKCNLKKSDHI